EGRRTGVRVHHQPGHVLRQRRWHHAIAEPPAGHRVRLRESVEDDDEVLEPGEARDGRELAAVQEGLVDLVGEDRDAVAARAVRDASALMQLERAPGWGLGR